MNRPNHMVTKLTSAATAFCLGVIMLVASVGCTSLKADVPFAYTPALRLGDTIEGKAVFEQIEDTRSKSDRNSTREITDCAEKLTAKLIEDFRTTRIFSEVDYGTGEAEGDFAISGKLEKFSWKHQHEIGLFIPFGCYLGLPLQTFTGEAGLTLEVKEPTGGTVLGQYRGSAKNKTTYNMYEFKGVEMGVELQYALREAVKQIKTQVTKDPALRQRATQGTRAPPESAPKE